MFNYHLYSTNMQMNLQYVQYFFTVRPTILHTLPPGGKSVALPPLSRHSRSSIARETMTACAPGPVIIMAKSESSYLEENSVFLV